MKIVLDQTLARQDLLQHLTVASAAIGTEVFAWREDLYWPTSRGYGYFGRADSHLMGGSKMRMFDQVWWPDTECPVYTTGVVQSNQVRQLAVYLSELGHAGPLHVMVAPDRGEVDPAAELQRGNLKIARDFSPFAQIEVLPDASLTSVLKLSSWCRAKAAENGALFLPRGMACIEGIAAARQIGESISAQVGRLLQKRKVLVLVVSGSGSTHIGLARGLISPDPRTKILLHGLSTQRSGTTQLTRLMNRWPDYEYAEGDAGLTVDDAYMVDGGGATPDSDDAVNRWAPILGFTPDRQYCGRLCQYLDRIAKNADEYKDTDVVLVVTGTEVEQ